VSAIIPGLLLLQHALQSAHSNMPTAFGAR
jgi:hypothetical protein